MGRHYHSMIICVRKLDLKKHNIFAATQVGLSFAIIFNDTIFKLDKIAIQITLSTNKKSF